MYNFSKVINEAINTIADIDEKKGVEEFYSQSILWSGRNDYYFYNKNSQIPHIPEISYVLQDWAEMGSGLYLTPDYETASTYGDATIGTLYDGRYGCANGKIILGINTNNKNIREYEKIKGRLLQPMKYYYKHGDVIGKKIWNYLTKDMSFVANIDSLNNTEIILLPKAKTEFIIENVIKKENSYICQTNFDRSASSNKKTAQEYDDFKKLYPHICHDKKQNIDCPSSCEYLKNTGGLPQNLVNENGVIKKISAECGTDAFIYVGGGKTELMKKKYMKYKEKNILLIQSFKMESKN